MSFQVVDTTAKSVICMEFQAKVDDAILITATSEQKTELADFIGATIENERNDITSPAGTGFEQLAEIQGRIVSQIDQDGPLKISTQDMIVISNLADAWRMYGFDQTVPENYDKFPVSVETVEQITGVTEAAFEAN